ncbi:MAG TPA: glycine--tRNA ligase subunit beta [Burkholderiales bacterium]|nr:glycine--tRNA ligase subunit beta [Burkholderiales bacterium]
MKAPLLVELRSEELPPKALLDLSRSFASAIFEELAALGLAPASASYRSDLATPRRLAVLIPEVSDRAAVQEKEVQGPATSAQAQAVAGFAKKHGVSVDALERRTTPKGEVFLARVKAGGASLDATLAGAVDKAIRKLPIPKVMRWGAGEARFVRPVHGLVMLHGDRVVPGEVLGLQAGNRTRGHRFMSSGELVLKSAAEYESALEAASVIPSFEKRRAEIERQLQTKARALGGSLGAAEDIAPLLDEVAALVEHPTVYAGGFDAAYLEVPQECLILTMRQNQKYFPLFDARGKLQPRFLIVSNMRLTDPRHVVGGNERVVRPRLEDARFFYNQDRKERLEARVPRLENVVYHAKLGSQLQRVQRIRLLAGKIARVLGADTVLAERAAELAKADLLTGMVGEFPELQGIMGRYYALHDKEPAAVADAIASHYRPRFAGDALPEGDVACSLALADKLDAIAGLFSIGQQPSGDKDPFGLRRAALGVVRILVEKKLRLSLQELAKAAFEPFQEKASEQLVQFVYERFANYLKELGYTTLQVDAVLSRNPSNLGVVPRELEAVKAFQALPEAESLAAANKRVANILRQADAKGDPVASSLEGLREPAELALVSALRQTAGDATPLYERGDYEGYLKTFAALKGPVDDFFDKVMVMADDPKLRGARLALLRELRDAMNRVADIARLAQ